MWVTLRKKTRLSVPDRLHHFYVASEEEMIHFDDISTQIKSAVNGKSIVKQNHLIKAWVRDEGIDEKVVTFYGDEYLLFTSEEMDNLYEWIITTREKLHV